MGKTPWQRHASKVMKSGGSLQDASATWDKKTNKPKSRGKAKSKPRKKSNPHRAPARRTSTVSKAKSKPKSRPKGEFERKRIAHKKVFNDFARAMGVPSSKTTFKIVGNRWVLKAGKVRVKRVKLSEAMTEFKKRARKRL